MEQQPLVLVVDDQIPATVMLQRLFEHHGYRVKCAYDGPAALKSARELIPDLILLDVLMPGMSGFDVLETLRQDPATAIIPTIMITALDEPDNIARGLNLGADDYIRKPFHTRELLARAESKMKARKLEDNLQRRTEELEALLRVSEELNQRREINELLNLITRLTLEMLPGDSAVIYHLNEEGQMINSYAEFSERAPRSPGLNEQLVTRLLQTRRAMRWNGSEALVSGFKSGMVMPLQHGDTTHGLLLILSLDVEHDERHLRLFEGIGRQAGLALRNAELYEIQMNYSLHLEDMVAEQTKELRDAQQLLVRSEKLASIGHLAASIAHEINNPLQPIVVILDEMRQDLEAKHMPDIRDIEMIQQSVERIRRIVSQLLDFTGKRSEGEETKLINIEKILEGIVTLNRKFFQQNNVKIITELPQLPPVYGSKDKLEQVFMNLALNAQAAMPRGGELYIGAHSEGENIVIEFADNGHGIPQEYMDRIFDPFFTTKQEGTGLGLFVSYGIIQSHNGSIEVNSVEGKGSRFTIKLPITLKVPDSAEK
ncbi:MAG: response regulator [Chloroflexi bacterium]|nr:response regulator [Chloroflexota bacterium]